MTTDQEIMEEAFAATGCDIAELKQQVADLKDAVQFLIAVIGEIPIPNMSEEAYMKMVEKFDVNI